MRAHTATRTEATVGNVGSFGLVAAAAASVGVGYLYGEVILLAFAHLWGVIILPAFMTIYLSGLAFCS